MKPPKVLLAFLSLAAVGAWGGIYQAYLKPPPSSATLSPHMSELYAFDKDLDMVHLDRLRALCNKGPHADLLYRTIAGQFGLSYLRASNKDRVTPEMMRAFYQKTKFNAGFCAGRSESFAAIILSDDTDPALVEVAIENKYPYKQVWFTDRKSLLHLAVENNRFRLAQSLVTKHPELLTIKDLKGQTPLDIARKQGKGQFTELLTKAQKRG